MGKQPEWIKLIRKLPAWISGAISLITATISFMLLIQENYKLGITVLGAFLFIALLFLFLYLAFTKIQTGTRQDKRATKAAYRFQKYRPWALAGIILEIIFVIAVFSFQKSRSFIIEGIFLKKNDLQLVDVRVVDEHITSALDIKVRNIGNKVAIIKLARIYVQNLEFFDTQGCDFRPAVPVTEMGYNGEYDLDLNPVEAGQSVDLSLAQSILPNAADRFKIILYPVISHGLWTITKIRLELIYNEDNQSIESTPILFISSYERTTQSAEALYGLGLSDDDILKKFSYMLDDPWYNMHYNPSSQDKFLPPKKALELIRDCYQHNLDDMTGIFSDNPIILSEQARVEYNEWLKAKSR